MSSAPLVLKQFSGVPEITQDAYHLRREAIAAARPIARVETPEQQMSAVEALRKLKEIRTGMESSRKAVKSPVLELGRKIDAIAADFLSECSKQEGRLQGLINHYQRKQLEARAEEERKLQTSEATASELRVRAIELRTSAENLSKTGGVESAMKMVEEAERLEARALDLELNAETTTLSLIDKPKGLAVRQRMNFQVTDPILFIQAYPQFWKWNADNESLKLDRMRILEELNKDAGIFHKTVFPEELSAGANPELVRPPGIRVYEEIKAHVR